jgi:type II restriction enzyme
VAPTPKQALGRKGELAVRDFVPCPRCGRARHLTPLATNFQCADLICKFCGFLAQVKSVTLVGNDLPDRILGAAWEPQHDQIIAGIFQPLFVCGFAKSGNLVSIDCVPAHILQAVPDVFEPRNPLGANARRAGWTGFYYNLSRLPRIGIKRVHIAGP